MSDRRRLAPVIAVAVVSLLALPATACRYSVRDTGFVDLGEDPYQLVLISRDKSGGDLYKTQAAADLQDANIAFTTRETAEAAEPALVLQDPAGRTLELARGGTVAFTTTGAAALLEAVALSPARIEILESALKSMAAVVLIEGSQPVENTRVSAAIEEAIRNVTQAMPFLPKPAGAPPALLRITPQQLARERITVWGLGFDPAPSGSPRVAIVFGRGRRLGSPLEGQEITQTAVEERLTLVGQDCECDLDRAWMKGPLLPGRWAAARQQQAAQALGFDPENPLVRTEVSRIVLRGPGPGQPKASSRTSSTLGYSEEVLEDSSSRQDAATPAAAAPAASAVVAMRSSLSSPETNSGAGSGSELDLTRQIIWTAVVGLGAGVLALAGWWWRKIRREQG